MSLIISKVFTYDTDAGNYIQAVEAADGAALEPATRQAINNFVIGCKQDGIWTAIKASCILAGARTLSGALVPLAGTAPTNFNFVSGDYNRKTGLVGDASTKYIKSNRANNEDPQNSQHLSVFVSGMPAVATGGYIGDATNTPATGYSYIYSFNQAQLRAISRANSGESSIVRPSNIQGYIGMSRSASSGISVRSLGQVDAFTSTSQTSSTGTVDVFRINNTSGAGVFYTNARLAFYSIGEALDLALLDARVTALITAFGVAIP